MQTGLAIMEISTKNKTNLWSNYTTSEKNATHTHRGIYSNTPWGYLYIHVPWSTIYDIHGMDSALDIGEQIDGKENNVYTYILYHYIYYICNMHCVCVKPKR